MLKLKTVDFEKGVSYATKAGELTIFFDKDKTISYTLAIGEEEIKNETEFEDRTKAQRAIRFIRGLTFPDIEKMAATFKSKSVTS